MTIIKENTKQNQPLMHKKKENNKDREGRREEAWDKPSLQQGPIYCSMFSEFNNSVVSGKTIHYNDQFNSYWTKHYQIKRKYCAQHIKQQSNYENLYSQLSSLLKTFTFKIKR